MKIGIVTTWFERGAAIVSRQFMDVLNSQGHDIYIYARGGEFFAKNDKNWNLRNVTWNKYLFSNIPTDIDKTQFLEWINNANLDCILFNEQQFLAPVAWAKEQKIPCIAYIDYYTKDGFRVYGIYDQLWCNTHRHFEAFKWHPGARYIPWGTNTEVFRFSETIPQYYFFHSAGMSPYRKGTDLFILALYELRKELLTLRRKSLIHTQVSLQKKFPKLKKIIQELRSLGLLDIVERTIPAPGLYHKAHIYVYPSRLDGIGLTLAEAACSGLFVITTNCEPMSEFALPHFSSLIDIAKSFPREDGYYWDMCEPSLKSLIKCMQEERSFNRLKNSASAINKFNFNQNSKIISQYLDEIVFNELLPTQKKAIEKNDKYVGIFFKKRNFIFRLIFSGIKTLKVIFR